MFRRAHVPPFQPVFDIGLKVAAGLYQAAVNIDDGNKPVFRNPFHNGRIQRMDSGKGEAFQRVRLFFPFFAAASKTDNKTLVIQPYIIEFRIIVQDQGRGWA